MSILKNNNNNNRRELSFTILERRMTESGHMQLILTITGSHGCTNSSEDEEEGADELRHQSPDAVRLRRLLPAAKCNLRHSSLLSLPRTRRSFRLTPSSLLDDSPSAAPTAIYNLKPQRQGRVENHI